MKHSKKIILSSGLLATIGFITSFSPNSMLIGKHSLEVRELASTSPNFTEIQLGEFDKSLAGVKMKVALNSERTRAVYNLEGDICTSCVGIQEVAIAQKDLENIEYLKMVLAKSAMEQIKDKNAKRSQPNATISKLKSDSNMKSSCEMEIEDGLLSCQKDEFLNFVSTCENSKEKSTCYRDAERFFNRYLKRSLTKGLSAPLNSDLFIEAAEIRDDFIRDLPARYDNTIRKQLLVSTSEGVLTRLNQNYNMALMTGGNPGYAATLAKTEMAKEINYQNRYSVGGQLLQSLLSYSEDTKSFDRYSAQSAFFTNFYQPLQKLWMQDHSKGLTQSLPEMPSFDKDTVGLNEGSMTIPRVAPGLQMPDGLSQRRLDANHSRQNIHIINPNLQNNSSRTQPPPRQNWNQPQPNPYWNQTQPAPGQPNQGRIGSNQFFNQGSLNNPQNQAPALRR
jgi:hypothetical protein